MIPIKDENPTYKTPFVVFVLIAINVVVFLHQISLGAQQTGFFQLFAVIPRELSAGFAGIRDRPPINQYQKLPL